MKNILYLILGIAVAFSRNLSFAELNVFTTFSVYLFLFLLLVYWNAKSYNKWFPLGVLSGLVLFIFPKLFVFEVGVPTAIFILSYVLFRLISKQRFSYGLISSMMVFLVSYSFYCIVQFNDRVLKFDVPVLQRKYAIIQDKFDYFPEYNYKVKVVELWFSNCGHCLPALRHLSELRKEYEKNPNVEFITVNFVELDETLVDSIRRVIGFNLPTLIDSADYFRELKESNLVPSVLIIDPSNHLRYEYTGFAPSEYWMFDIWLDRVIDELLEE